MRKKAKKKGKKEEGRKENADCLHGSAKFGLHLPQSVLSFSLLTPSPESIISFQPFNSFSQPPSSLLFHTPSLTQPPFSHFLLTNLQILLPSSTPLISFSISHNFHFLSLFNEASFVGSSGFHFLALHVNPISLSLSLPFASLFLFSFLFLFLLDFLVCDSLFWTLGFGFVELCLF